MLGSGTLSLFLQVEPAGLADGGIDLFAFGTVISGQFAGLELHTYSDESGNRPTAALPLYLAGSPIATGALSIPLWVDGCLHHAQGAVDLFLRNDQSGVSAGLDLYVRGSGTTAGALPCERSLPLFLERNTANSLTLFLQAPGTPLPSGIDLFVRGDFGATGMVPLFLSVVGYDSEGLMLTTHGF